MKEFVPLCMTPEELASWRAMNQRVTGKCHAKRPCSDCPAWFANEMRTKGLCNGALRRAGAQSSPERLAQWRAATARRRAGAPRLRRTAAQLALLAQELHERRRQGGAIPAIAKRLGIDVTYARDLLRDERWKVAA